MELWSIQDSVSRNLAVITDVQLDQKKSVSLQPGGMDLVTGFKLTKCAFSSWFSKEEYLNAWDKGGAAPLTWKFLSDPKVSKTLGDGDNKYKEFHLSIHAANDLATHALTEGRYKGQL